MLIRDAAREDGWIRAADVEAANRRAAEGIVEKELPDTTIFSVVPGRSWAPQQVVVESHPVRSRKAVDA